MSEELSKKRRFAIRCSGVGNSVYHDGKIKNLDYIYFFSNLKNGSTIDAFDANYVVRSDDVEYVPYSNIFQSDSVLIDDELYAWKNFNPLLINYYQDDIIALSNSCGLYTTDGMSANSYSIYRREYEVFGTNPQKSEEGDLIYDYQEVKGVWTPVVVDSAAGNIRDYNVQADKTYQYILYPSDYLNNGAQEDGMASQIFANYDKMIFNDTTKTFETGTVETSWKAGEPVTVHWEDWNIVELVPEDNKRNVPIVKKTFRANLEQFWIFKYALETGTQTQNIIKNEFQTLGKYPKIGYGQLNAVSGEVTAMLGSEIRPYVPDSYTERLWMNRGQKMQIATTNERALMLKHWRDFVASPNPKLLRDNKGQSWIVQVMSGSNTPKTTIKNQPDTITFSWKQIDSVDNVIIYGDITPIPSLDNTGDARTAYVRTPMFKTIYKK